MAKPLFPPLFYDLYRSAVLALAGAVLAGCSIELLPTNITPDVPLTHSVEQAERKLQEAARERADVEARFAASEQVCYTKFFVNNCLDKAKETRRSALAIVRAIEVEAEYFQRKAAADERDRALAEAARQDEQRAAEAAAAAAVAPPPAPAAAEPDPAPARAGRAASHAAARAEKRRQNAARDKDDAARRAANAADFEKRKAESAERQREVEARKAERAAKAAPKPEVKSEPAR